MISYLPQSQLSSIRINLIKAYAFLLPFSEWLQIRLNNILLICICAIWLADRVINVKSLKFKLTAGFILATSIFFIQLFDLIHGGNYSDIGKNIFMKAPFFLFPLALSSFQLEKSQLNQLQHFFIAGCLLACMLTFRFLLQEECADVNWMNIQDIEEFLVLQRPYYGIYLSLAICFSLVQFKRKKHLLYLIAGFIFLFFLIWIQAKMALLILTILAILGFLQTFKNKFRKLFSLLMILMILSISFFLTKFFLQYHKEPDRLTGSQRFFVLSINTRLEHFQCALETIQSNPFFGIGVSDLKKNLQLCYDQRKTEFNKYGRYFNVHNEWLEETARHGILGLLVYMLAFFLFFKKAIQSKNKIYFQFLLIVLFAGMAESIFSRAQGVLMIAFFNTIFFFTQPQKDHQSDK